MTYTDTAQRALVLVDARFPLAYIAPLVTTVVKRLPGDEFQVRATAAQLEILSNSEKVLVLDVDPLRSW
jgi:hypothetical protein